MNKYLFSTLFFVFFGLASLYSQSRISGNLTDTTDKRPVENAVIVVMTAKDSMLVTFERTSKEGAFECMSLKKGDYILLISADNYADFTQYFTVNGNDNISLGMIAMPALTHLLQDVIVHQSIAKIRLKGDTTEYRADSFYVAPNATVEDLLKILPGITVDERGNITANGKKIREVLVDGEPFFSDDPVLVTRNLRSNMIDKVQVYEKKSEQELFTGVKSRDPKTVVDLKLKPDKRKGYFGNITAGAGLSGYHLAQGMFNRFNGKERFSVFAIRNNTGGNSLSSDEISRFSDNTIFSPIREIMDPFDTWRGVFDGKGFPLLQTAGVHYNNRWKEDAKFVNANYKIVNLKVDGAINTEINQVLNGRVFENTQAQTYRNRVLSNRANGIYQYNFDSTSTVRVSVDVNRSRKNTENSFLSASRENGKTLVNSQQRNTSFQNDNDFVSGNINWMKKLHKKRRTLSVMFSAVKTDIKSGGMLLSLNHLYNGGATPFHTDTVDQYKTNQSGESDYAGAVTYTEPVSAKGLLSIVYGVSVYNGNSEVRSYTKSADQKYTQIDSATGSIYTLHALRQKANIQYDLSGKNYSLAIGNEFNTNLYEQTDIKNNTRTTRRFLFVNPFAVFNYTPRSNSQWSFGYQGTTVQPLMHQLQPLLINIDPNNKFIGNQQLNPSYTHSGTVSFYKYRPVKDRLFSSTLRLNKTISAIAYSTSIDSFARSINQWINIQGNMNGNVELLYSTPVPRWKLTASMSARAIYDRSGSVVNGKTNYITSQTYSYGLSLRKSKEKKYAASAGFNLRYIDVGSSLNNDFKNNYFAFDQNYSVDLLFLKRTTIHADGSILLRENIPGFAPLPARTMVNAWVSRRLLASQTLVIKAAVNNLLNMNTMNSRFVGSGYAAQTRYDVIQRYFLLTIGWDFANKPSK